VDLAKTTFTITTAARKAEIQFAQGTGLIYSLS